nr:MAG TPA: HNH endonuclease [Caudoviricetes sp.]
MVLAGLYLRGELMPIYKRCSRCGKRIQSGSRCPCQKERHREYDRYSRDNKSKKFYDSVEWQRSRENVLELDQYIDVYMYMTEGVMIRADTVHHIIPLRDDWNKRNDPDNLMSLNHDTHSKIEQLYKADKEKMQIELQEMLTEYRKLVRQGGV